ncbi:MAG: hypothetical protein H7X97_07775 [Opitutaceae bacterium]|nr:hypothetical protein [Verrucomicrobiales bacterium]
MSESYFGLIRPTIWRMGSVETPEFRLQREGIELPPIVRQPAAICDDIVDHHAPGMSRWDCRQ